jgi:hypothetical protein
MDNKTFRRFNLMFSFILAGFFLFYSLIKGEIIMGILLAYVFWSWWWGVQLLWPSYIKNTKYERETFDASLMKIWLPIFYSPLFLMKSLIVGIFGGGFYKFFKYLNENR